MIPQINTFDPPTNDPIIVPHPGKKMFIRKRIMGHG
jgi:hypothetical protein